MRKKFFLLCVLAIMITFVNARPLTSSLSNSEIARIINMSKEANQQANHILNPNKIYPGQNLTFMFDDGYVANVTVEPGDSQWKILKTKILSLIQTHGNVVDYGSRSRGSIIGYDPPTRFYSFNTYQVPAWVITLFIVLAGLTVLAVIWQILFGRRNSRAYLNDTRAYSHQLALINQLGTTGGNAVFSIGDMNMCVAIPKQDTNKVPVTSIHNVWNINTTFTKKEEPKEQQVNATEEKKEEEGPDNTSSPS